MFNTDRVQHAGRRFGDSRWRVAEARLEREALGDEAADFLQVEEGGKFGAVTKGA